jgi:hypothetical protein
MISFRILGPGLFPGSPRSSTTYRDVTIVIDWKPPCVAKKFSVLTRAATCPATSWNCCDCAVVLTGGKCTKFNEHIMRNDFASPKSNRKDRTLPA